LQTERLFSTSGSLLPEYSSTLGKCKTLFSYKQHKQTWFPLKNLEKLCSPEFCPETLSTSAEADKMHLLQAAARKYGA